MRGNGIFGFPVEGRRPTPQLVLDLAPSGSCAVKLRQFRQNQSSLNTELVTYCLGFIRRTAQTDVGDILKIGTSDHLNDGPHADP